MHQEKPAVLARRRERWMRHDADRWLRPDWRSRKYWVRPPTEAEQADEVTGPTGAWSGKNAAVRADDSGLSIADLRRAQARLAHLRWLVADLKFDLTLRALRRKYSPDQPRVPRGNPEGGQWTDAGGGGGGLGSKPTSDRRINDPRVISDVTPDNTWKPGARYAQAGGGSSSAGRPPARLGASFPGATNGQLVRFDMAVTRTETALAQIRRYDPDWRPTTQSFTAPERMEGAINHAEARAREAEAYLDKLRLGIGGNLGPSLTPLVPRGEASALLSRAIDGPSWITGYRAAYNTPDLFGRPTWNERNVVAVTKIDGAVVFGTNSTAPGYTDTDQAEADTQRWNLLQKYPELRRNRNIGAMPNDSFYHAETTVLLKAALENGGTLRGKTIEVHVSKEMCQTSCPLVLPKLGLELGNPTVKFVDQDGKIHTMHDGEWLP